MLIFFPLFNLNYPPCSLLLPYLILLFGIRAIVPFENDKDNILEHSIIEHRRRRKHTIYTCQIVNIFAKRMMGERQRERERERQAARRKNRPGHRPLIWGVRNQNSSKKWQRRTKRKKWKRRWKESRQKRCFVRSE